MNRHQIRTAAAVTTLVACFVFESAQAAPAPVAPSERISLSGLNLDTETDAKVLYRRLKKAALQVCQRVVGENLTVEVGKCSSRLLDIAVTDVNRPALTALHGRPSKQLSAQR